MNSRKDNGRNGEGSIPVCKFTTNLNATFVENFKTKLENTIMKNLPILGNFLSMGEYLESDTLPTLDRQELKWQLYKDRDVTDAELETAYASYLSKQVGAIHKRLKEEMDAKRSAYAIIMEHISEESKTHMRQDQEFIELEMKTNDPQLMWKIFIRTHTSGG